MLKPIVFWRRGGSDSHFSDFDIFFALIQEVAIKITNVLQKQEEENQKIT